eukprot:tig00021721_g23201.t1
MADHEVLMAAYPNSSIAYGKPYTPEHQGSVERANRDSKPTLEAICYERRNQNAEDWANWALAIPDAMESHNSMKFANGHKMTPIEAMTGRRPSRRPLGIEPPSDPTRPYTEKDIEDLLGCSKYGCKNKRERIYPETASVGEKIIPRQRGATAESIVADNATADGPVDDKYGPIPSVDGIRRLLALACTTTTKPLQAFLRAANLPHTGNKEALKLRILAYLKKEEEDAAQRAAQAAAARAAQAATAHAPAPPAPSTAAAPPAPSPAAARPARPALLPARPVSAAAPPRPVSCCDPARPVPRSGPARPVSCCGPPAPSPAAAPPGLSRAPAPPAPSPAAAPPAPSPAAAPPGRPVLRLRPAHARHLCRTMHLGWCCPLLEPDY